MSKKSSAVIQPNLGLYFDREPIAMSNRMVQDGLNFRVREGKLSNLNMGWDRFGSFTLNGPVMMIADFKLRTGTEFLVFATLTDLYKLNSNNTVSYISARYGTGTITITGTAVVGVGTAFLTNTKIGDYLIVGANVVDPAAAWVKVTAVADDTHLTLQSAPGNVAGSAYTIRKTFTGSTSNIWQNATFVNNSTTGDDELWMTNGIDTIVRWNGATTQVERMTALSFTAKSIVVFSNMMIFANLVQGGTAKITDIINSNPGQPDNVTTGLASQFKVHGGTDRILKVEVLGDNLTIYSERTVTIAQFVGSPIIFVFRQISVGIGILSTRSVANFGNYHEFLGHDGQYYFDGATIKNINRHVWREILRQQDPSRISLAFSHFDEENGDLIWSLPLTTDSTINNADNAYVEHYLEEPGQGLPTPHSKRGFPFISSGYYTRQTGLTWDQITDQWQNVSFRWNDRFFFAAFPLNMVGSFDGKVYTVNTSQDADGAALTSFVKFGRRAMFDGRIRGLLARIYPFVKVFSTALTVTAIMYDSADGNLKSSTALSFSQLQGENGHFTIPYRRGRFFEVQFGTSGVSLPWEIAGYDVDVRPGGKR